MTRKFMLIAAGSLAVLSLSAGAAMAQDEPREDMFDRVDANGDGVLTPAERDAAKLEAFTKLDADGNGYVTEEEMKAAHEARKAEMKARMEERRAEAGDDARKRGDGDRKRRWGKSDSMRDGKRGNPVERLDTDGDGAVSQAEFLDHELRHMDKVDADGDGNITRVEADAAKEAMRAKMKERWQERKAKKAVETESED